MQFFSSRFAAGLLTLLLLAQRLPAVAQTPAWQAAQAVATGGFSRVAATATDAAGNVYLAGTFNSRVTLGTTTLTSRGGDDVFVAKFNPVSNQFVWVQQAGGTDADYAKALVVNGSSVYVAGYFSGPTANFGTTTLASSGDVDVFVTKLTDAGSFVWAQQAGGIGEDFATALAVSNSNVYVAGGFNSPTASFGVVPLTNAGSSDVFVAKLTDAGSFMWAQRAGGTSTDYAQALAVSGTSVYVAGSFISPTTSFGTVALTSAGSTDMFVTKLTDAGNVGSFAWAQRAGGTDIDYAQALAVSGTSVYVAGSFNSLTASFGTTTLANAGGGVAYTPDVFVAKLADAGSTGSFAWAQRAGGTGYGDTHANTLAVTGTSVYVAGDFASPTASFGATTLTNIGGGTGYSDVFVAQLTDAGNAGSFAWAQQGGGTANDYAFALVLSGTRVYVAGAFGSATAGFGTTTLTNTNPGTDLGFLASLTDATLTAAAPRQPPVLAQLYPNPARHATTLRRPAGPAPGPLTLCDALGRPVRRYSAPASVETALDLRGLPAGLYLLQGAGPAQRLLVE